MTRLGTCPRVRGMGSGIRTPGGRRSKVARRLRGRLAGAALIVVLGSAGPAVADIVHLKSGRTIEGTTQPGKKPGTIEVRTGAGVVVTLSQSEIDRVEKRRSPVDEVEARLAAVEGDDLETLHELLAFSRDKRLAKQTKAVAARILAIDPHDEAARRELGYVVHENRWVLESELRKRSDLVLHEGEWMTLPEKARREAEAGRKELQDLFDMVESSNQYVQEFAIRKILARRDAAGLEVFAAHLRDPGKVSRMVAVRGLGLLPAEGAGSEAARKAVEELHRLALTEDSAEVLKVLWPAMAKFHPSASFRLALETATGSSSARERSRAADILYTTLTKAVVPDLCRAVVGPDGKGRPEIREVLKRALGVDHGFDPAPWLAYWKANQARFFDD